MSDRFSAVAWNRAAPWFHAVMRHPFVTELRDGTLPREVFHRYLVDDAHYLTYYAGALVTVAGRWPDADGAATLARFGAGTVEAERELQAALLGTDGCSSAPLDAAATSDAPATPDAAVERGEGAEPTPTCLAYANTLRSWAAFAPAGVAVAGLLPCFRIYAEVGARLAESLSTTPDHPYREWASMYGDPAFAADTRLAEELADAAADRASPAEQEAMHDAYMRASRFEWMFWDAAYRGETWPVVLR